ncbi:MULTISPECIES: uridine kinase [unclassified Imperialibacter]|uniref:uridine kinase n=1 Tax=unclassified Imperialibacter TaxID=2629706 RepID=UPI0012564ED0|nr:MULTISPECIES: uridine kinase [unclassified Imperialibacter]CAD5274139.1 Uridine kinase [Imperialibacter sp. 75]CAD5287769.1 Uridine kinase [Imperialibacter sp. 89]VVT35552.1 Uridine kinase [Imperialibacter sp. EC-SDR9]
MKEPLVVGMTGGSASGKTLFLSSLMEIFQDGEICLVSQDNYYKSRDTQPVDENGVKNFDTPLSIDFDEFRHDLEELKRGKTVQRQEYTFNNPNVTPKDLVFKPSPIIIAEGIFVFYDKELSSLFDLKLFIEAKNYLMLKRRITRDALERGYDLDDVLYRYEKHVAPTFEKYIEPLKHEADIIIPNNHHFHKALQVVVAYLKMELADRKA